MYEWVSPRRSATLGMRGSALAHACAFVYLGDFRGANARALVHSLANQKSNVSCTKSIRTLSARILRTRPGKAYEELADDVNTIADY
eukprot:4238734-Pleurochrysis_carterae.AAC.2